MKTSDFSFDLPPELIAQYPGEKRGMSRLMVLDRAGGGRGHRRVPELPEILRAGDLLVFNNSRVRKARIYGFSARTGAKFEFLLLNKLDDSAADAAAGGPAGAEAAGRFWKVMARRGRGPGSRCVFRDGAGAEIASAEITGGDGEFRFLRFDRPIDDAWLDRYGHIPLPPYIKRKDAPADSERYQTVYASRTGSVAAPTAGLHFTKELLERLAAAGVESAFITLHVGLGTFLPVRSENIEDHKMHEEIFSIDEETAAKIEKAKALGRRVIAVGTTSVRTLESAWDGGRLRRGEGAASIFIYPGYRFKAADCLFTNFHTPRSTLLMLVSAFAEAGPSFAGAKDAPGGNARSGRELILESYAEAIREGYRFFSYGDAMLIV
ncbi:MAG: tRNA preQ1(34) S-adenosylmethionine ribosyltransferase-isomerase QueA [Treponema sp.]|jgi:S-adenosylmethionine:tRNA ribosyltransferase-isomerase|nr:tRNA preQ1(34) S-adenosylmethionine ribosyltransferase-isomerase QueA [Treponema sp.]